MPHPRIPLSVTDQQTKRRNTPLGRLPLFGNTPPDRSLRFRSDADDDLPDDYINIADLTADELYVYQLVDRARTGDAAAFGEFYQRYFAYVFAIISSRMESDTQTVEDLTQDVFIKVLGNFNRFRWQGGFTVQGWLARIAVFITRDYLTKGHYPRNVLRWHVSELEEQIGPADETGEGVFDLKVRRQVLADVLGQLTARQRLIIELRFFHHLQHRKIAELTGLNVGQIKALQFRGLLRLRKLLQDRPGIVAQIKAAGSRLKGQQRRLVELRLMKGLTLRQAAKVMQLSYRQARELELQAQRTLDRTPLPHAEPDTEEGRGA